MPKIALSRDIPTIAFDPEAGTLFEYDIVELYIDIRLPESTRTGRDHIPYKTVFKEYFVLSWAKLVGNIGGTLGLLIGFSFLGSFEWILIISGKLCKKVDRVHETGSSQISRDGSENRRSYSNSGKGLTWETAEVPALKVRVNDRIVEVTGCNDESESDQQDAPY